MSPVVIALIVLALLLFAIVLGHRVPGDRLSTDTKDIIKLAMGLIGTMTALLLGLLVSSANGTYDAERTQVIQMAAKIAYVDRILSLYGPQALEARKQFRAAVEDAILKLWPADRHLTAELKPNIEAGDSVYFKIEALTPQTDTQQKLKALAETGAADLAQMRALLLAQSTAAISAPMLFVVVSWLVVIFATFSVLAPPHFAANVALVISAIAVSGAIFLLLELGQPFNGVIRIPSREMVNAMNQLPK